MLECVVVCAQILKTTRPPDTDIQNSSGMRILDNRAFCIHSVKDCLISILFKPLQLRFIM